MPAQHRLVQAAGHQKLRRGNRSVRRAGISLRKKCSRDQQLLCRAPCPWWLSQQIRRIALDEAWFARLASRTGTEFQHDSRGNVARTGGQRNVIDKDLVIFGAYRCGKRLPLKFLFEPRHDFIGNPIGQAPPNLFASLLFLTLADWQRRIGTSHQVACDRADIVSQVDILRKPVDHTIGLGQRCATFEDQMTGVGPSNRCRNDQTTQISFSSK